ncbi:MAG: hypothetical protein AAF645_29975, partial [Myxococcota bacterium]
MARRPGRAWRSLEAWALVALILRAAVVATNDWPYRGPTYEDAFRLFGQLVLVTFVFNRAWKHRAKLRAGWRLWRQPVLAFAGAALIVELANSHYGYASRDIWFADSMKLTVIAALGLSAFGHVFAARERLIAVALLISVSTLWVCYPVSGCDYSPRYLALASQTEEVSALSIFSLVTSLVVLAFPAPRRWQALMKAAACLVGAVLVRVSLELAVASVLRRAGHTTDPHDAFHVAGLGVMALLATGAAVFGSSAAWRSARSQWHAGLRRAR